MKSSHFRDGNGCILLLNGFYQIGRRKAPHKIVSWYYLVAQCPLTLSHWDLHLRNFVNWCQLDILIGIMKNCNITHFYSTLFWLIFALFDWFTLWDWFLLSLTDIYSVGLIFTLLDWYLLSWTDIYSLLLIFSVFGWILLSSTDIYSVFDWFLLSSTDIYDLFDWHLLSLTDIYSLWLIFTLFD